jgi:hypothetical protein
LADAFAKTHAATEDLSKSVQDIANEHKDLQKQYDELTMTSTQLLAKQRDALDASNRSLFDQVQAITAMKDAATGLLGGADDAFSALQKVVNREKALLASKHDLEIKQIEKQIETTKTALTAHKSLADALHSTLDQMQPPSDAMNERAKAQAQIAAALAIARAGGPLPEADSLKKALGTLGKDSSALYATYQDYQRDFYSTQNDIASLSKMTDATVSVEQKTLDTLTAQKDASQAAYDAEIKRLDDIVSGAQSQIDLLKGMDTSLLTIAQAMTAFGSAVLNAKANPIVAATSGINSAYETALGRTPDAAGLAYFQDKAATGTSVSDIIKAIKNSPEAKAQSLFQSVLGRAGDAAGIDFWTKQLSAGVSMSDAEAAFKQSAEYKKLHNVPGFASGGDFMGGLRIVGENGPELEATGPARYTSNNDLMARLRSPSDNNAVLVAAVERLTKTVEQQQEALDKIASATKRQADGLEVVTDGFNAMRTTA